MTHDTSETFLNKDRQISSVLTVNNCRLVVRDINPLASLPEIQEYDCGHHEELVAVMPAIGSKDSLWMFFEQKELKKPTGWEKKTFPLYNVADLQLVASQDGLPVKSIELFLIDIHGFTPFTLGNALYLLPPISAFRDLELHKNIFQLALKKYRELKASFTIKGMMPSLTNEVT